MGLKNEKQQGRLDDLKETKGIVTHLHNHYEFILEHFDEETAKLDLEIAVIQEKKDRVLQHFVEAPEQLIKLKQQLIDLTAKENEINTGAKNVNRLKSRIAKLREKLADLEG